MIKITKLCKGVLLVGILFAMTNCSNDETAQSDNAQYSEVKLWFDNHKNDYNTTVLKYVKDFQWNDAIVTDGNIGKVVEIPFTLEGNLSASSKTANLHNVHHRLMFVKDAVKGYKLLYVQIYTDNAKSKILDNNFNYYNIKNDFDGKVFVQELNTSSASKLEFRNGNKIIPSLTSRMAEEVIECVWLGYWDDGGHFEPIELMYCDSMGDSGEDPTPGYGGGGTTPPTPTPTPTSTSQIKSTAQLIALVDSTDPNAINITFVQNGDTYTATAKIALLPWANIELDIVQAKVDNKYTVNNVTTALTGLTTGLAWSQSSFSQSTSGTTTTVIFSGMVSVVMPLDGISTLYSYRNTYSIKINNTNGKIISGTRLK